MIKRTFFWYWKIYQTVKIAFNWYSNQKKNENSIKSTRKKNYHGNKIIKIETLHLF